jgi:hypothetical protein
MNLNERIQLLNARMTSANRTERIWVKGANEDLPIYRAPVALLYLNYNNRRFKAEAQGVAEELNRTLDPLNSEDDERSIMSLLLDREPKIEEQRMVGKPNKETRALLSDWEKRGQEHPFWIRPDGLVVNGNRRLAMIKRQQEIKGEEFSEWVDVIVFPDEVYDDDVLFDLEAREQLTEGLKVRYSDINILLTLREAAMRNGIDWTDAKSVRKVAGRIQHIVNNDVQYAETQLNAIKYMQLYLELQGKEEKFFLLDGMVERFRVVGSVMSWILKEDESRSDAMLNVLFAGIGVGETHLDLRDLRRLLRTNPIEFDRLYGWVEELQEEGETAADSDTDDVVLADPDPATVDDDDQDEDEDDTDETSSSTDSLSTSAGIPNKEAIKRALDTAIQGVRDAKHNDKRAHVLSAANRLAEISAEDLLPHLGSGVEAQRLRVAIDTIVAWAADISSSIELGMAEG